MEENEAGELNSKPKDVPGFISVNPITVKDFPVGMQPREKAEEYGMESLATDELLAIILRTGLPNLPITELCRNLLKDHSNSLLCLQRMRPRDLERYPGIGPTKRQQIEAIMVLAGRYHREAVKGIKGGYSITDSESIYEYVLSAIPNWNDDDEHIWIILLNRALRVIKDVCVSTGGSVSTVFDLKKILHIAIVDRADSIVMVHNHPSGNLRPSAQDDNITDKLKEGAKLLELRLVDHIIVSAEGYYSYHDHGRL